MDFYDNYVRLCNSVGKTPSAVALEIGIEKSTVSRWSKGSSPNHATKIKVADYFNVSVETLSGKNEQKEKPAQESGPNKDKFIAWVENAGREELIEALQAVTKRLGEL